MSSKIDSVISSYQRQIQTDDDVILLSCKVTAKVEHVRDMRGKEDKWKGVIIKGCIEGRVWLPYTANGSSISRSLGMKFRQREIKLLY